ncbi:putative Ig domain-containing protein [Buchananella felis]|uniref:putative Ig domain-containing protein n=1 Tax=Buchananella felis TaxID=3231492 RepID=UPI0035274FB7
MTATAAIVLAPAVTGAATAYANGTGGPAPTFYDTCRGPAQLKIPAQGSFTKDSQAIAAGLHDVAEGVTVNISDGSRNWSFTNDAGDCPSAATVTPSGLEEQTGTILDGISLHDYSSHVTPGSGGSDRGNSAHMFDGRVATFWHTPYSGLTDRDRRLPHWITADLGAVKQVDFIEVTARQTTVGHPKQVTIFSSDDGQQFEAIADAVLPDGSRTEQKVATIEIPQTNTRYLGMVVHSTYSNRNHVNVAEMRFGAKVTTTVTPGIPKFSNLAGSNSVHIPNTPGVVYSIGSEVKAPGLHTVTGNPVVTAAAKPNRQLAAGAPASWTPQFTNATTCTVGQTQQGTGAKLNLSATVRDWDTESFGGRGGETDSKAIYALDGNYNTLWHTPWSRDGGVTSAEMNMPHALEIDLGEGHEAVRAINYVHRGVQPANRDGYNGQMKTVELLSSTDGQNFNSIACYSVPDVRNVAHPAKVMLNLPQNLTDRYLRLHITEAWVGSTAPATGTNYVTINELEFFGENQAPAIVADGVSVGAGGDVNIPVTVTDPEQHTVTVTLQGAPEGLQYADGAITGRAPVEARAYTFTIVARDQHGKETTKQITLTVTANRAPTVTLAPTSVTGQVGEEVSVTVTTADEDGHTVTVELEGAPTWLTYSDTTKKITGTAEAGTHTVRVKATDALGTSTTVDLPVTITPPPTPVAPAAPVFADLAGAGGKVTIPAVEGLQYKIGGSNVQAGENTVQDGEAVVTVEAKQGFVLSPGTAQWSHTFVSTACVAGSINGGRGEAYTSGTVVAFDTESINGIGGEQRGNASNVVDGDPATYWHTPWKAHNSLPASARQFPHFVTVDLGQARNLGAVELTHRVKDSNATIGYAGQPKQVELLTSTDGAVFSSAGCFTLPDVKTSDNPVVTMTLANAVNAKYVRVQVSSAHASDSYTLINELKFFGPNRAPELTVDGTSVRAGGDVNIPVVTSDPEQHTVTVTLQDAPQGLQYANGAITGKAPLEAREYPFTVVARDQHGKETSKQITLTVTPNAVPTLSLAVESVTVVEGQPVSVLATVGDTDGDEVTLSLEDNPTWLRLNDKTVTGTPTVALSSPVVVKVKASDGRGGEAVKALTITVNANRAPVVAAESASVRFGSEVNVPVQVTDADGHTFEVVVEGLPAGLTYGANKISGTAPANAGQHEVTIRATDQYGKVGTKQITLTVVGNAAPTVTLTPAEVEVFQGGAVQVRAVAADTDGTVAAGAQLADGSPDWLSIAGEQITGTVPAETQAGPIQVTVKAVDNDGATGTATLTITVKENHAPVIEAADLSARQGAAVNIPVVVTDQDQHNVTVTLVGAPSGFEYADRAITGTVPAGQPTVQFTIRAEDELGKVTTKELTITVVANVNPTVTLAPAAVDAFQGAVVESTITSADSDGNVVGDPVLLTGAPNWLSIAGGMVTGTVPADQAAGPVTVTVQVTDNDGATGTAELTITVKENHAPVIEAQDASARLGGQLDIPVTVTDADSHTFDVTVTGAEGLTWANNAVTGPVPAEARAYQLTITARDELGKVTTKLITLTVAANANPTVTVTPSTLEVFQGAKVEATIAANDTDGQIDGEPMLVEGAPTWLNIDGDKVTGTVPAGEPAGQVEVTVQVTDNDGGIGTAVLTITVKENHAPSFGQLTGLNPIREGDSLDVTVPVLDVDNHTVKVTLKTGAPDWLSINEQGHLVGTAPVGSAGTIPVSLIATDELGLAAEKQINVEVRANAVPTLSLAVESVTVVEGQPVSVLATVGDTDGDEVTLSLEDNPTWLSLNDKTVTGTPTAALSSPVVVKVKASDGRGGEAVKTLTITVNANQAPVVAAESASVRFGSEVNVPVQVTDADGHTFDVVVEGLPAGLTYGANKISGTAPANAGQHEVTIRATDQYGKVGTKQITLTVVGNAAPTVTLTPAEVEVFQGGAVQVRAVAADTDGTVAAGAQLADGSPDWLSIAGEQITGTVPAETQAGPIQVTVKAVDNDGATGTATLTITVKENHAPTVTLEPTAVNANVGAQVSVTVTTGDEDGHAVTVELQDAPSWLTYSAATKKITGTAVLGTHTVRVKATDALGKVTTVDLPVTITTASVPATAQAPVFVDLAGEGGKVIIPAVEGVQYKIGGQNVEAGENTVADGNVVVTVVAKDGFTLAEGTSEWTYAFVGTACVAGGVNGGRGELYTSGSVVDFDTQSINGIGGESAGYARHVVDGNTATFWHTPWRAHNTLPASSLRFPHHVTIDLGQARNLGAVELTHRVKTDEARVGYAGQPKNVELLTSVDGAAFTSAGCFTLPDVKTSDNPVVTMTLPNAVNAKFVRVQITGAHYSSGFTLINELKFFGPNRAPVFGDIAAEVNATVGGAVDLALPVTDADNDTVTLTLAEGAPAWLRINEGKLTGTAPADAVGDHAVTITATDAHGATATKQVTVKVAQAPNTAPTVTLSTNTVNVMDAHKVPDVTVTTADPDQGDQVTLTLENAPAWLKLTGNKISGDVPAGTNGNFVVTVKGTDKAGATGTATLTVRVTLEPNTPPTISVNPAKVEIREKGKVEVAITAADADARDTVTLSMQGAPAWLKLQGTKLVGTAPAGGGNHTVTVKATDTRGAHATAQVQISVDANDAPVLTVTPASATVVEGKDVSFTVSATDAENDAVTFALQGAPSWLSLKDGKVSGTAPELSAGELRFTVVATDALGARTTKDVNLTVKEAKKLDRYSGADRVATSVDVWQRGGFTSKTVLLANATNFADAVAAGPLAGALKAPVVLTGGKVLEPKTVQALKAASITKVILVGGENSVSAQVERSLRNQGIAVQRLGGTSRFATAISLATEVGKLTATRSVMVVDGTNFADGLTAGAVAPQAGAVVVYSNGKNMPGETRVFLQRMQDKEIYGVGGAAVTALNSSGWTTGVSATAVTGADRYATALAVAKTFAPNTREFVVASGASFADALPAGALAAHRGGVLLLTSSSLIPPAMEQYLRKQDMRRVAIVGGTSSVSVAVERTLRALLG